MPDLRASVHVARGVRGVRLEFTAAAHAVLLSDFNAWQFVLNEWYLRRRDLEAEARDVLGTREREPDLPDRAGEPHSLRHRSSEQLAPQDT